MNNFKFIMSDRPGSIISKFLTITDNYNLQFIIRNTEIIDWKYLQQRDFPHNKIELSKYNAINLDNGNIISHTVTKEKLIEYPFMKNNLQLFYDIDHIFDENDTYLVSDCFTYSKKNAMEYFKISKSEIETLPKTIKKYNDGEYDMHLYYIGSLQKLTAKIYKGITNFNIKKLYNIKEPKIHKCAKCLKEFKKPYNLKRHEERKNPCNIFKMT